MRKVFAILFISSLSMAQGPETSAKSATPKSKLPTVALPLTSFLEQVKNKNEGYKGAALKAEGAAERVSEADLMTSPNLFLVGQWSVDQAPRANPALGSKTLFNNYQLGLSQQTPFGLTGKLYYNVNYTDITGASTTFTPKPTLYDAKPVFEGTLSLWRNLFGKEVRSTQEAMEASSKSVQYQESFISKVTLAEAEGAYWRLALARRLKQISGENLDRSQKLRDWNSGRVSNGLGDRSELLQADGSLKMRKLEFQTALDEERAAALQFNSQRGVNSDKVEDVLEQLPDSKADLYKVSTRGEVRDDVSAALEGARASRAESEAGVERNSPTLELYGQLAYNGQNKEYDQASDQALKNDYPTSTVGVRFNIPLEIGNLANAHSGYKKEAAAADYKYQRKLFEEERDWNDLAQRYNESRSRLALAEAIESAQKEKYDYERGRHNRGRTTTFMVLQFEQDYALAQTTRLKVQSEILGLIAQMKTYGSSL